MRRVVLFVFIASIISACSFFKKKSSIADDSEDPIAKAYDAYLYPSDLTVLNFKGLSEEDSVNIAQKFILEWARHQVIVEKAEQEGKIDFETIELKAEELKYQLIQHEFEKNLVYGNLDTLISNEEIAAYYTAHKADYELKQNVVKCLFVKLSLKSPNESKFLAEFSKSKVDLRYLKSYCDENADVYSLNDSIWVLFDDVIFGSPFDGISDQIDFIQNTRVTSRKDKESQYYLRIFDYRIKNSESPLQFHRKEIANIIYNQRKIALIKNVEEKLYNDALNEQEIEFYK